MCCNYGVISRSEPRFSLLTPPPPPTSRPDPLPRISFSTHHSCSGALRSRVASVTVRAAVNEAVSFKEPKSFYELLGIPETGTLVEIKQAYKQLARKYHPDVSPPDRIEEYTERFIRVQEAYETLSDPKRRALYDRDMARGLHLAFTARRRYQNDEMEVKSEWKSRWQVQLSELKRRSVHKENSENMSWGARMRWQRDDAS